MGQPCEGPDQARAEHSVYAIVNSAEYLSGVIGGHKRDTCCGKGGLQIGIKRKYLLSKWIEYRGLKYTRNAYPCLKDMGIDSR
jgi:hypothetical protein